jgi:hypothetical protein
MVGSIPVAAPACEGGGGAAQALPSCAEDRHFWGADSRGAGGSSDLAPAVLAGFLLIPPIEVRYRQFVRLGGLIS